MGRVAQKSGKEAENLVEAALDWYTLKGYIGWWTHPGPKMLFFGKHWAKAVGIAPPDYLFFMGGIANENRAGLGGMLEVKRTKNKGKLVLRDSKGHREIDQFWQLRYAFKGTRGKILCGYLVLWREFWDWRFYPIRDVELATVAPPTVVLYRERGMVMDELLQAGPRVPAFLGPMIAGRNLF